MLWAFLWGVFCGIAMCVGLAVHPRTVITKRLNGALSLRFTGDQHDAS